MSDINSNGYVVSPFDVAQGDTLYIQGTCHRTELKIVLSFALALKHPANAPAPLFPLYSLLFPLFLLPLTLPKNGVNPLPFPGI